MFLTIFFILITFLAVFIVYDEFRKVKTAPTEADPPPTGASETPPINVFLTFLFLAILIIIFSSLYMLFKHNNMLILPVFIGIVGTILVISYVILPAIYKPSANKPLAAQRGSARWEQLKADGILERRTLHVGTPAQAENCPPLGIGCGTDPSCVSYNCDDWIRLGATTCERLERPPGSTMAQNSCTGCACITSDGAYCGGGSELPDGCPCVEDSACESGWCQHSKCAALPSPSPVLYVDKQELATQKLHDLTQTIAARQRLAAIVDGQRTP